MKKFLALLLLCSSASAQSFAPVPYTFAPNTTVVPSQLMTNFSSLISSGNAVASNLNTKVTALLPIPSGVLIFFNLNSCPSGWTVSAIATSLFIRGIDNGAGRDPTGTLLGATETGGMQDHRHNTGPLMAIPVVDTGSVGGSFAQIFNQATLSTTTVTGNPSTGNHGTEVRPVNISLLLCSKN